MNKIFLLTTLMLGMLACTSGQKEKANTFYVLNVFGAKVYEEPSLDSKVIKQLKPGEKIMAEDVLQTEQSIKMGAGFQLDGSFVKIKKEGISGYVFSSDLTKRKPELKKIDNGILLPDILGKELNKRIKKRSVTINHQEYEYEDEITEFENGTYTFTAFDGCFDHVYVFRHLSLSEVYHQLTFLYVVLNESEEEHFIEIPMFIEKKGNEYLFDSGEATQNLKIIDNKDGTFTISSCDCT